MRAGAWLSLLLLTAPADPAAARTADFGAIGERLGLPLIEPPPVPPPTAVLTPRGEADGTRWEQLETHLARSNPELPRAAMRKAFDYARRRPPANLRFVTIIDFRRPSTERRMSVIRLADGRVQSFLVAHGRGSGGLYAERFSNRHGTHMSSLGLYLTGGEYYGGNGRSLRLHGLEASNSAAAARAIVLHGSDYVSDAFIRAHGRLGRSWGCPAVEQRYLNGLIEALKGGSVLLIYR